MQVVSNLSAIGVHESDVNLNFVATAISSPFQDDDDDIPVELKAGEEYEELVRLKRLRREKMKEEGQARHIGFKVRNTKHAQG